MMLHKLTTCTVALMFVVGLAGLAQAADTTEVEPNDSLATAMNIDSFFSLGSNPDVFDSATIPWVSISATGDATFDYYSFTVSQAGALGYFDIDYGWTRDIQSQDEDGSFDAVLAVWDSSDVLLQSNDNYTPVDPGSTDLGNDFTLDPFLSLSFDSPGTYYVGVAKAVAEALNGGWSTSSNTPQLGDTYELQVSIQNHGDDNGGTVVPAPAALFAGGGLIGLIGLRRRR